MVLSAWPAWLTAGIKVTPYIILPPRMLLYAVILSAIAFWMNRRWVHIAPLILPLTLALASGGIFTLHDAWVGPAVIEEQGMRYAYFAYGEFLSVLTANIAGVGFGLRRRRRLRAI